MGDLEDMSHGKSLGNLESVPFIPPPDVMLKIATMTNDYLLQGVFACISRKWRDGIMLNKLERIKEWIQNKVCKYQYNVPEDCHGSMYRTFALIMPDFPHEWEFSELFNNYKDRSYIVIEIIYSLSVAGYDIDKYIEYIRQNIPKSDYLRWHRPGNYEDLIELLIIKLKIQRNYGHLNNLIIFRQIGDITIGNEASNDITIVGGSEYTIYTQYQGYLDFAIKFDRIDLAHEVLALDKEICHRRLRTAMRLRRVEIAKLFIDCGARIEEDTMAIEKREGREDQLEILWVYQLRHILSDPQHTPATPTNESYNF